MNASRGLVARMIAPSASEYKWWKDERITIVIQRKHNVERAKSNLFFYSLKKQKDE